MNAWLRIRNLKTGLTKMIDANKYTLSDFRKTFKVYVGAGYAVKILRG